MKTKVKIVSKLKSHPNQFPENKSNFRSAHNYANAKEKKKYPQGYKELEHKIWKLHDDELLGHMSKKGKIEISKKVPKKNRAEVIFHEKVEHNRLIKELKKHHKKI